MYYQIGILLGICPGICNIIGYYHHLHLNASTNILSISNNEIYLQITIFILIICYQRNVYQFQEYFLMKYELSIEVYYGFCIGILLMYLCKSLLHIINQSYQSDFQVFKDNQNLVWKDDENIVTVTAIVTKDKDKSIDANKTEITTTSDNHTSIFNNNNSVTKSSNNSNDHTEIKLSNNKDNNEITSQEKSFKDTVVVIPPQESSSNNLISITNEDMNTSISSDRLTEDLVIQSSLPIAKHRILAKVSSLMNIDQEMLAYEITLDPSYQLPNLITKQINTIDLNQSNVTILTQIQLPIIDDLSRNDLNSIVQLVHNKLLRTINDKLINSFRRSTIDNLDQLEVGMVIPIRFQPNPSSVSPLLPTSGSSGDMTAPRLSAKILTIHYQHCQPTLPISLPTRLSLSTTHLLTSTTATKTTIESDQLVHDTSIATTATVSIGKDKQMTISSIDVEYICDGLKENNVDIHTRVVLSRDKPDPSKLLVSLEDLCHQIASLTPNRKDIQQNIMKSVDLSLLYQMILNKALDPKKDLLPIFRYFQETLKALQAPSRTNATEQWIQQLSVSFEGKSLDEVASLIPLFFERSSLVIEEIQFDMANYFITILSPTLQVHGHVYLQQQFQHRALIGLTSLDALASIIFTQVIPEDHFKDTMKDCMEAEICVAANGMVELPEVLLSTSVRIFPEDILPNSYMKPLLSTAIMARAFISILQLPLRLDTPEGMYVLPETFHFDAKRLSIMRDIIDRIALVSSIMISTRQLIAKYFIPPWCIESTLENELQQRLDVLLSQNDANMTSLTIEIVRYIQQCYQILKNSPLYNQQPQQVINTNDTIMNTQELHEKVNKTLKDTISKYNPILNLFSKRVYKLLFRVILGQNYIDLLPSYSLHSPAHQHNINTLLTTASKLFKHNVTIHRDLYCDIIARACSTAITNNSTSDNISID